VAEPGLHGANINACTQPSRGRGVPEAVQVPMVGIQFGPLGNDLAPVMKKTIIRLAVRRRENKWTTIPVGVLLHELCDLTCKGHAPFFPVFWRELVFPLCGNVDTLSGKVQV
jgi:hypothetical protein